MQIAYIPAENPSDRRILIKNITSEQYDTIRSAGFKWIKKDQYFEGMPSLFTLRILAEMVRLPPELQSLKNELEGNAEEINSEKAKTKEQVTDTEPAPVSAKLYAHQVKALHMALKRFEVGSGYALLHDCGCGKSLTSIAIMGSLFHAEKIRRVLVVCPSSIVSVWEKEVARFAKFPYSLRALQGEKKNRISLLEELEDPAIENGALSIAVINYESTHRDGMFEALQEYRADLIICDESQRIKSPKAAQSKAMHKLGAKARYRLILSGTPVQNNCVDLFSQYLFLDPSVFGANFFAFRARYVTLGGFQNKQIIGYKNQDDLIKKAHSIASRVTLEECVDMPGQIFIDHPVKLSDKEAKQYKTLRDESVAEIENSTITADTILTKILRLQQFTGGFVADDDGRMHQVSTAKLNALADILEDYLSTGKKAVIFARFTAELKAIRGLLDKTGIRYGFIDGSVPQEQRGAIVEQFQSDPECRVFVAQTATAGLGITLTASSLTIFYSLSYNYADYQQATARTYRIGQKEKCTYINLVAEKTIDSKILQALSRKEDTAKAIVDNWRSYFE